MILNALRVALRIDSGIMILICISAKPAGLSEMLFHGRSRRDKLNLQSESAILSLRPLSVKMQIRTVRRLSESAL